MKNFKNQLKSLKAKITREDSGSEKSKEHSLLEKSHGEGYSGSSYNAKGSPDHGKIKSNKKRR